MSRALLAVLAGAVASCMPTPPPEAAPGFPSPTSAAVCQSDEAIEAAGGWTPVPSLKRPPDPQHVRFWHGDTLPEAMPDAHLFVRCRPCDCEGSTIVPWDAWDPINTKAFARLRGASAPYAVAVVPGFHAGGAVMKHRLKAALRLLKQGWVASLVLSGGHRRTGHNEARMMFVEAQQLAKDLDVDIEDRLFLEPCAVVTLTNFRNSMRMLAALGIDQGVLVTDSKMSGQAMVFYTGIERLAAENLECPVGRMSYLSGDGPLPAIGDDASPCQPHFSLRNNPLGFFVPTLRASIFWVSPNSAAGGNALECRGGSLRLLDREPDDQDPYADGCAPIVGATTLSCSPKLPAEPSKRLGFD